LPLDAEELAHTARRHLQEAKLFVHLIGAKYGVRPDGDDRSIPHIQYDLVAELDRRRQVAWLKPDQTPENQNQRDFIALIKNQSPNYWQARLEDLKAAIQKKLQPPAANGWDEKEEGDPVNVCLYCHEDDMSSIGQRQIVASARGADAGVARRHDDRRRIELAHLRHASEQ
jgi:hypothetical protein